MILQLYKMEKWEEVKTNHLSEASRIEYEMVVLVDRAFQKAVDYE